MRHVKLDAASMKLAHAVKARNEKWAADRAALDAAAVADISAIFKEVGAYVCLPGEAVMGIDVSYLENDCAFAHVEEMFGKEVPVMMFSEHGRTQ